jgi:tRNA-specific 2-thiouridylase
LLSAEPVDLKIRYRTPAAQGWARLENDRLIVRFREPQWAVAPGQSVVAYRDGRVLAGGRILETRTGETKPGDGPDR